MIIIILVLVSLWLIFSVAVVDHSLWSYFIGMQTMCYELFVNLGAFFDL